MLGQNMVCHFGVYRRSLVEDVGRMRPGFEGSQDYDLLLRALGRSSVERVRHIPAVLYHWRRPVGTQTFSMNELDRCVDAARRAVNEFLSTKGIAADVTAAPTAAHWQRVKYRLPTPAPIVSVIIPTKNRLDLIRRCVHGVLYNTDYPALELTIVDHDSDDHDTRQFLSEISKDQRVQLLRYSESFNFSAINNFAVAHTRGDILAF
jgi:hypothetical protein